MELWIIVGLVIALNVLVFFFATDSRDSLDNAAANQVAFDRNQAVRSRRVPVTLARKSRSLAHATAVAARFAMHIVDHTPTRLRGLQLVDATHRELPYSTASRFASCPHE
jgi:hypothetical protein